MPRYDYAAGPTATVINFLKAQEEEDEGFIAAVLPGGYSDHEHANIVSTLVDVYQPNDEGDPTFALIVESLTLTFDIADWFAVCTALGISVQRSASL